MRILVILFFPLFLLFAQTDTTKDSSQVVNQEEVQLQEQEEKIQKVIEKINDKTYLTTLKTKQQTKEKLELLKNKININKRANNTFAVKRDELEVMAIEEKILYEQTLKDIIKAKEEFRKLDYYKELISNTLNKINNNSLEEYRKIYEEQKNYNSYLSKEFSENFEQLTKQRVEHTFILNYLKDNIIEFRKTNFLIDEFNLQSIIKKIDSLQGISYASHIT